MEDQIDREEGEPTDWARLRPELDAVLAELRETDRTAVLLRVFEGRSFAEVGAALCTTAEGARKRVDRSLERLRAGLARRGIKSTAAALAVVLAQNAVAAAPAGLAAKVSGTALAGASSVGVAGTLAGVFHLMCRTKTAVMVATVSAALCVGVAVQQAASLHELEAAVVVASAEVDAQRAGLADLRARIKMAESARRSVMGARPRGAAAATGRAATAQAQIELEIERGAEFFAAHPEARALFETVWRAKRGLQLELLARELQLTSEQRDALDRFLRSDASFLYQLPDGERVRLQVLDESPPSTPRERASSVAELAAVLGAKAERLRPALVECRRLEVVHETVNQIAGLTAGSGVPLSPAQAAAMTRLFDTRTVAALPAGSPFSIPEEGLAVPAPRGRRGARRAAAGGARPVATED